MFRARDGFTLVELMVTVTILAILAVVAIFAFGPHIRRARSHEAVELLMHIKMQQEQYFATYSTYVSTAATDTDLYPRAGAHPKNWIGATDNSRWDWSGLDCTSPADAGWCDLAVRPSDPTYFRAASRGWTRGAPTPTSPHAIVKKLNPNKRWFYAVAHGDLDGDGTLSTFIITSQSRHIISDKEIE